MSPLTSVLVVAAILVGCLPPLQTGINATLSRHHGHPLWGALTNTAVASLALIIVILVYRAPAPNWRGLAEAPTWAWFGGVLGATMVLSAILLAPRLGAASYVSSLIVGTVTASIIIDHFGLVGFDVRPVSLGKLVGGGLVVSGMIMVRAS